MARTSKRMGNYETSAEEAKILRTDWRAGIYARLSVDSHDRKNESIDTQIEIAKEYIKQSGDIELVGCYKDLGKSGRNFAREGFEQMMSDIRMKKINCVIVKDLSRFGRNYIETSNYIEKIFPFMKVRFISVTDKYDSEYIMDDNTYMSMNLKNIVNELYARDISERVKISKKAKQEMGSYTGGEAPYGYCIKKVGDKRVLYPDADTKNIAVRIFEMYAGGCSYKEIIEELYKKRIQSPRTYYATKEVYCPNGEVLQQWSRDTIKNMLKNPCYIGTLFQSRTSGRYYQKRRRHEVEMEEDVSVVEHTHEPLIEEELFLKVMQRFEQQSKYSNNKGFSKMIPQIENIFADKIFCGECGKQMRRTFSTKKLAKGDIVRNYYYVCNNKNRIDEYCCRCGGISLRSLLVIIKEVLEKEYSLSEMRPKGYCLKNEKIALEKKMVLGDKRNNLKKRQETLILQGSKLYLKYREGKIDQREFLTEKEKSDREIEMIKNMLVELEMEEQVIDRETKKRNHFIRGLMKCRKDVELDRELVDSLIKQINVYYGNKVEIIFNYNNNDFLYGRQ